MIVIGRRVVPALCALALALGACQGPAAPPAPVAPAPSLSSQAADALDKGNYAKAADLYRQALAAAPDSLPLHYGLAVAASYLNSKEEAIREFRWVLRQAAKGSSESEAARKWLVSAGAIAEGESPAPASDETRPAGTASLEGQMVLPDGSRAARRMVIMYGLPNTATKEERYQVRTDDNGRFRFPSLAAGPYMVTDAVGGKGNWRLRVEVQPGQAASLDLTPANLIKVKDDFPNQGSS